MDTRTPKTNRGFTLLEVMIATAMLTAISLVLYEVNNSMVRAALHQESMTILRDEARNSLMQMTRLVRMADTTTIVTAAGAAIGVNPVNSIEFQPVEDTDGNGNAINEDFSVGLGAAVRFVIDTGDANGDGLTTTQLIEADENGAFVRILTSHLNPAGGVRFWRTNPGIQISLVLLYPSGPLRPPAFVRVDQVVAVRN